MSKSVDYSTIPVLHTDDNEFTNSEEPNTKPCGTHVFATDYELPAINNKWIYSVTYSRIALSYTGND